MQGWRLTTWLGIALAAISAAAVAVDAASDVLDAWMPNIATSAATIAVTVTVVDWIVRRESRSRLAPLLAPPLAHINGEFGRFVAAVAEDYATTHVESFRAIPSDPLALLDLWLAEQDTADRPHIGLEGGTDTLREMGREFALQVDYHEQELGAEMEPELRAALRSFARALVYDAAWRTRTPPPNASPMLSRLDPERNSYRTYVSHSRALGEVLRRHAKAPVLFMIDPATIEWAQDRREMIQRQP